MAKGDIGIDYLDELRDWLIQRRVQARMEKNPPKVIHQDEDMIAYEIPDEVWESPKVNSEKLSLLAEIKLYDDPYIPMMIKFYDEDEDET